MTANNEPVCACKPGYVHNDEYGCVDESPPILRLRHDPDRDQTLRLKQGDNYQEYMVDIIDENAEDYLRSLKISYSRPLPNGCLTEVGEFHVNYTVAMPWTTPPYVRTTRRVVIDDIDECEIDVSKYKHSCPSLAPQCDRAAGAKCINTIGSYACQCPPQSSGDGFLESAQFGESNPPPSSYNGGTSCVDTSKPIITLKGPNPKIFRICECGGLSGILSKAKSDDDSKLHLEQQQLYSHDIKEMIRATAGAELCATHEHNKPKPSDCVKAIDHTHQGDVDLSDRVVVGEPIQKGPLHWVVPYNVKDDVGNEAITVYRDVKVEEVELASMESKIRQEVIKEQEAIRKKEIQRAVFEAKEKWAKDNAAAIAGTNGNNRRNTCPSCPPCDCPDASSVSAASCQAYCEDMSKSCQLSDQNWIYGLVFFLQGILPANMVPVVALVSVLVGLFVVIRLIFSCCSSPQGRRYDYVDYRDGDISNDELSVLAVQGTPAPSTTPRSTTNGVGAPTTWPSSQPSFGSPPANSMSVPPSSRPFFSPGGQSTSAPTPTMSAPPPSASLTSPQPTMGYDDSIFNSPSIIRPSRTGDGVQRRNPYQ